MDDFKRESDVKDEEEVEGEDDMSSSKIVKMYSRMVKSGTLPKFEKPFMMYVEGKIEGKTVKMFIDSGAQSSAIDKKLTEEIGVWERRINEERRFAVGVGGKAATICGKISDIRVTIGKTMDVKADFVVMEFSAMMPPGGVIIGLDFLRKHNCCLDLSRNQFRIYNDSVNFLPISEIPLPKIPKNVMKKYIDLFTKKNGNEKKNEKKKMKKVVRRKKPSNSRKQKVKMTKEMKIVALTKMGVTRKKAFRMLMECGDDFETTVARILQKK